MKGSRMFTRMFVAAAVGVVLLAAPVLTAEEQSGKARRVIIGTALAYPPYSFLAEEGQPSGYNAEISRAVAWATGLDLEVRIGAWGDIREALEKGEIDAIVGMYYSRERDRLVDFSQPFTVVHHGIFAREGTPDIHSEDQLRGKALIVVRGDIMHDYVLDKALCTHPIVADTHADALKLLASGESDYGLVARLPALHWVKELGLSGIRTAGPPVRPSRYCFAVKEGDADLLARLDEGLAIVDRSGRHREICEKWLGLSKGHEAAAAAVKTVRLGVLANGGAQTCWQKWGLTADYLSRTVPDCEFELVPLDHDEVFPAVERGEVDFVLASPSYYVQLETLYGVSRLVTLRNLVLGTPYTQFAGVIFCRADRDDIRDLADLEGKRFMAVDKRSFGGWQMGWREFQEHGIDPHEDFADLRFGGTHDAVVSAVRDRKVDAGTVRTDTLERMAQEGKIRLEEFRVMNQYAGAEGFPFVRSTAEYPEWPMAKVAHTSDDVARGVAAALLAMPADSSSANGAGCAGWTIPLNYQAVHDCLKELRIGPYKDYGKVTARAVVRQYWPLLLICVLAAAVVLTFAVYGARLNRRLRQACAERERATQRLEHLNLVLRAIGNVNQLIAREKDRNRLLKEACKNLIETGAYYGAWSALFDESGGIVTAAQAGLGESFLPMLDRLKGGELTTCGRTSLAEGEVVVTEDPAAACPDCPLSQDDAGRAGMTMRLEHAGNVYGLLCVSAPRDATADEEERALFREVANDISFAVHDIEVEEQRKRVQDALRESEQRYRTLVESSHEVVFRKDRDGRYRIVNLRAAVGLGGTCVEDVLGKTDYELLPKEQADALREVDKQVMAMRDVAEVEEVVRSAAGEDRTYLSRKWPSHDDNGRVDGVNCFAMDITERRRAEEELRTSEAFNAALFEHGPVPTIVVDREGRIVRFNLAKRKADCRLPAIGDLMYKDYAGKHAIDMRKELMECMRLDRSKDFRELEYGGRFLSIEICPFPMGAIITSQDITTRVQFEAERLRAAKLESLGLLAGGIAHDFNNLLTIILGNVSHARMDLDDDSEIAKGLLDAEAGCRRAKGLTQQLMTFAKGGAPLKTTISVSEIIEEAAGLALRGSNVVCEYSLPSDLWPVEVDPGQIGQVISNLVINANQAMAGGGTLRIGAENVTIRASHALPLKEGRYLRISVKDEGIGIAEEHLARVFDPYFSTKEEDRGLGLATCYSIVTRHGGHIAVESEPRVGSTFHIYLPASEKELPAKGGATPEIAAGEGRVLVMDDQKFVQVVARRMLSSLGYEVETAADGAEAIELYRAARDSDHPFDAVILDLTVPGGMGGKEVVRRLIEIDPQARCIVSSGYSEDAVIANFSGYGFRAALSKPYEIRELAATLLKALGRAAQ